jgi:ribosomal protein S18 acetylase RimI-like enzyme
MGLRIRPGAAGDADFLARIMFAASRAHLARGLWEVIVGSAEADCLDYLRRLALAEPRSLYYCENFLIAEIDGQPAAALSGFETRDAWTVVGEAMYNVQRDLGWTDADAEASYQRVASIWTGCMPPDIGADFAIESVATLPQFQRRGAIGALLNEVLAQASHRGCRLAQITTYLGNQAALAAYEKSGFRVYDEKRCSEAEKILGVPGFVRLTHALS